MRKLLALFFFLTVLAAGVVLFTQRTHLHWPQAHTKAPPTSTSTKTSEKLDEGAIVQKVLSKLQSDKTEKYTAPKETSSSACPCLTRVIPQVVEDLVHSVVSIAATQNPEKSKGGEKMAIFGQGLEVFKDFLDFDNKPRKIESGGSGFIIKGPDGQLYILTNAHVVAKSAEIIVMTHDKTKLLAEIKAADSRSDIAILKLKGQQKFPEECKPMVWGDAAKYPVGSAVVAIGNPFEFGSTVSDGIISFKNRDIPRPITSGLPAGQKIRDLLSDMMQHTAPINVGSSGGPLIGIEIDDTGQWAGRVIGVNSTMLTTTGGNMGISFAIPSTIALSIIDKLFEFGKVDYAWLGTIMQELIDAQKSVLELSTAHDAYKIIQVEEGSPAQKAGLEKGDVITHINGHQTDNLTKAIQRLKPGEEVVITVLKGGIKSDKHDIKVTLGTRPDEEWEKKKIKKDKESAAKKWPEGAFKIQTLDLVLEQKETTLNGKKIVGFKVIDIDPEHPKFALEARETLEPGDTLLSLNGEPFTNRTAFEKQIEQIITEAQNNKDGCTYAIFSFNVKTRDDEGLKDAIYRYELSDVAE